MAITNENGMSPLMRKLAFTVILSSAVGTALVYCVLQPILPIIAKNFGAGGDDIAKLAASVPAIGMLIGGLVGGWLITLVGKRPVILTAIVLMGVLGVGEGFISSAGPFLAARLVLGLGASLLMTASVTWLGDIYEGEARSKAVGILQGVATFGSVPLVVIVGIIAGQLGWRTPFWLFLVFAVPAFLLAVFALGGKTSQAAVDEPEAKTMGVAVSALRLWHIYLLGFGVSILNFMGVAQLPFLIKEQATFGPAQQGLILACNALMMGVGAVSSAAIHKRLGEKMTVIVSVALAGICNVIIGFSHDIVITAGASILSYIGLGVMLAMAVMMVLNRATAEERPAATGYATATGFAGQFANTLLLAPIIPMIGLGGSYLFVGLVTLALTLIGFLVVKPASPAATAAA
jgi:MFS family permease